jgi:hypothetical protein
MNFEEILAQLKELLAVTKELLVQLATRKELLAANHEELLAAIKGDQTQVSSLNSLPNLKSLPRWDHTCPPNGLKSPLLASRHCSSSPPPISASKSGWLCGEDLCGTKASVA